VTGAPVLLLGALMGLGLFLVARELLPSHPELVSALARIEGRAAAPRQQLLLGGTRRDSLENTLGGWLAARLAGGAGLRIPHRDLALVGRSVEQFLLQKVAMGLLGLLFPPLLAIVMGLIGLQLPFPIPVAAGLVFAGVLFFTPDLTVRQLAEQARSDFKRAVCAYLDLTALQRASHSGAITALQRAAEPCRGWVFTRIREELLHAELDGVPPWDGLKALAEDLGVPELGDVGDIMRMSGEDGAAVYETLRSRAKSLRGAILAQHEAQANSDSEKMVAPGAVLTLLMIVMVGYPAFARIVFG
jgi:hypothetical protein